MSTRTLLASPPLRFLRCAAAALLLCCPAPAQGPLGSGTPEPALAGAEPPARMAVSPDGGAALLQEGAGFRAVDLRSGRTQRSFGPLQGKVRALALAGVRGAAFVATETEVWTAPVDREDSPRKLWTANAAVQDLSLSPDLDLLAVATAKGPRVLDPASGRVVWSPSLFSGSAKPCAAVRFAPVGAALACALGRGVELLAVPGFKPKQSWACDFPVLSLAFSPDARLLALAGGQGGLRIHRVADGTLVHRLDAGGADIGAVAFAADATACLAATGRTLRTFSDLDEATPTTETLDAGGVIRSLCYSGPAQALYATLDGARAAARWPVPDPLRAGARARRDQPRVAILAPERGARIAADRVDLAVRVLFPATRPVTTLRVLADGRPAKLAAPPEGLAASAPGILSGAFRSGATYICPVELPDRDTTLLVVAEGPNGAGEPAMLTLQRPRKAVQAVPPVLTLLNPAADATFQAGILEVAVRMSSVPGQPVQALRVAVDGVPVALKDVVRNGGAPFDPAAGWVNGETYRIPVPVPDRDCSLLVVAETAYAASSPASARLRWRAPAPGTTAPSAATTAETTAHGGEDGPEKIKAGGENATRILEGGPQTAAVPMEVDAQGRLRWKGKAAEPSKKPAFRDTPAAAAPPVRTAAGAPAVHLLSPTNGGRFRDRDVQLSVRIQAPAGQEASQLQVFVDGAPVDATPQSAAGAPLGPPFPSGQPLRLRVPLPPQDCQVSVVAGNAAGQGRPALVRFKYDGKAAPTSRSVSQLTKPRIAIFEPQPNALVRGKALQLGVRIGMDPRQPPPSIRVLVDAQEVKAERLQAPRSGSAPAPAAERGGSEDIQYYTVPLPPKDCTIVAYADTPFATSDPAMVKVRWDSPTLGSGTDLPTLYLLSVGVSKYRDKNFTLTYPAKDARDFASTMALQKGKLYKDVVARVRTDETATRDNIMDDLEWIQRQATQHDVVIAFFAGHGINDVVTGNYYYLPWDAQMEAVKRTMIPGAEIHSTLARLTGTRLLFMDTCHAGNVTGVGTRGIPDLRQFLQDLKESGQGLVVITSSRPGQKSQEHPSWNNGAFTKALVEGLKGKATKDRNGFITFTSLDAYITQRVKELTQGTQAPASQKSTEISDFPIAFSEN